MAMGGSDVSVVIPLYNGELFIGEALASVFTQTVPPREILVVDDASTDGSPALVERLQKTSPVPLRLLRLTHNSGGPARPIDIGIGAATSKLVMVLDQDDILHPQRLELHVAALANAPDAGLVFSLCSASEGEAPIQSPEVCRELEARAQPTGQGSLLAGDELLALLLRYGQFVLGFPGMTFRRAWWRTRGNVQRGFLIAGDYDWLCWLACRTSAVYVPRILYYRRLHGANLSSSAQRAMTEVARVRVRYLVQRPDLARGSDGPALRTLLRPMVEWLITEERHLEVLRLCGWYASIWGIDRALANALIRGLTPRPLRTWNQQAVNRTDPRTDGFHPGSLRRSAARMLERSGFGRPLVQLVRTALAREY